MADQSQVTGNKEAWTHVTKFKEVTENGNIQVKWICHYCNKEKTGNIGRVEAHLGGVKGAGSAGCEGDVPPDVKARMALIANQKKGNKLRNSALRYQSSEDDNFWYSMFTSENVPTNPNGEPGSNRSGPERHVSSWFDSEGIRGSGLTELEAREVIEQHREFDLVKEKDRGFIFPSPSPSSS